MLKYFNVYMWSTFLVFFFSETQGFSLIYDDSSSDSDEEYSDYTSSEDEDGLLQIIFFIKQWEQANWYIIFICVVFFSHAGSSIISNIQGVPRLIADVDFELQTNSKR